MSNVNQDREPADPQIIYTPESLLLDHYHHDQPERHVYGGAFHPSVDPQPVGAVGAVAFAGVSDTPAREDHVHAFVGGSGGGGGLALTDVSYRFVQATASTSWTINHTLGFYPNVTVVDSAHQEIVPEKQYTSASTIQLTFSAAVAGEAYLS